MEVFYQVDHIIGVGRFVGDDHVLLLDYQVGEEEALADPPLAEQIEVQDPPAELLAVE